jgi:hypothetical protein
MVPFAGPPAPPWITSVHFVVEPSGGTLVPEGTGTIDFSCAISGIPARRKRIIIQENIKYFLIKDF